MSDRLKLEFAAGLHGLEVRRFTVHEAISSPWRVEIFARSTEQAIPLEPFLNQRARFTLHSGVAHVLKPERAWEGVVSHMEQVRAQKPTAEQPHPLSTYYLRIVPKLWLLGQRTDQRIFQRLTVVEIVEKVLKTPYGIVPARKLARTYRTLDYVVQYDETDLDFISRHLEQAGISYYFDFTAGGVLTLDDHPQDVAERPSILFADSPSQSAEQEFVTRVRIGQRVRQGNVTTRDFDFRRKQDYPLFGRSTVAPAPEDFYERYRHAPGSTLTIDPDDADSSTPIADDKGKVRSVDKQGTELAQRTYESVRRPRRFLAFRTNCIDLAAGATFTIDNHPRDDVKKKVLIAEMKLDGTPGGEWVHEGEAVFADVAYAPDMITQRPQLHGVQTAVVVGPPGKDEIYTDEFGRVRVQFQWDRQGKNNADSSCWMRVSQGWAGRGFGTIMIPRIGQEVLVGFFEGDPDLPVVVGRVYNAVKTMPKEAFTPKHQTRSTWMSDTTGHADNSYNEIRYEDALGKEYVYLQAQRDMQRLVKRHETERTGENRALLVGKDRSAIVARDDVTLVGVKYSLQMMEKPTPGDLKILELGKPEVKPAPTKLELVDGKVLCTSGDATMTLEGADGIFEATGQITFKAGGDVIVQGGSDIKINCN